MVKPREQMPALPSTSREQEDDDDHQDEVDDDDHQDADEVDEDDDDHQDSRDENAGGDYVATAAPTDLPLAAVDTHDGGVLRNIQYMYYFSIMYFFC